MDLDDALQHPGRRIAVDISTELDEEADLDLMKPLEGYLEIYSTGNLLMIEGEFSTTATVDCARCSGPLETKISFTIDEQFPVEGVPSSLSAQDYARVAPEDEPFPLFEENNLMVEALLRQSLLLSMPNQPLCPFGWDGDCPQARELGVIAREQLAKAEATERFGFGHDRPLADLLSGSPVTAVSDASIPEASIPEASIPEASISEAVDAGLDAEQVQEQERGENRNEGGPKA